MNVRNFRKIEWWIPICAIILCGIGLIALFSASYDSGLEEFKKQIVWMGISIGIMIVTMLIDYNVLVKLSPILYGIAIISVIAVLFTKPISGARSWFVIGNDLFSFQPAETAKVFVILFLAYVISTIQKNGRNEINKIPKLALILLAIAVPVLLIIVEPDYGTATAYIVSFLLMIFVAGIDRKYIITAFAVKFEWFPIESIGAWGIFIGIFLICFIVSTILFEIYFRITGDKYTGILNEYKNKRK